MAEDIFKRYPIIGQRTISTGSVPVPYHVYDGDVLFIGGTGDFAKTQALLQNETVKPMQTSDGRALLGIWVCDFANASLGPHHELQLSIFVHAGGHEPSKVPAHPLAILRLISLNTTALMLCYRLWNNTPTVVAYNRELLGLDARLTNSTIATDAASHMRAFSFTDPSSDLATVCTGKVRDTGRNDPAAGMALMGALGVMGMFKAARMPWLSLKVVNPISAAFPRNGSAQTYTNNASQILNLWDTSKDELNMAHPAYRELGFTPQFVNHARGTKFIYLAPE